jgi:L-serine dehydratase
VAFCERDDLVLHRRRTLPEHPNGMIFRAFDGATEIRARTYYSVGGGFVRGEDGCGSEEDHPVPHPFGSGDELLAHCAAAGVPISEVMRRNERTWRSDAEIDAGLLRIWDVMQECVRNGSHRTGVLPGGLAVRRRAAGIRARLEALERAHDPLDVLDWVSLFAIAVNEENASGGRVVTAPTNGAAGVVPAVLHYYRRFVPGASDDGVVRFLLTAGAIGSIIKRNASISGAEVGCQGEVGSACAMAAAGLTEVLGGTPEQAENAAEIGIEHHLGLTCDPVGGLVQIPCIERNAVAATKAIHAARLALQGTGDHVVGQGDTDHAGHGGGHEGQVQGDVAGWVGGERGGVLSPCGPRPHTRRGVVAFRSARVGRVDYSSSVVALTAPRRGTRADSRVIDPWSIYLL